MASIYRLTSIGDEARRGGVNGAVDATIRGVAKNKAMKHASRKIE